MNILNILFTDEKDGHTCTSSPHLCWSTRPPAERWPPSPGEWDHTAGYPSPPPHTRNHHRTAVGISPRRRLWWCGPSRSSRWTTTWPPPAGRRSCSRPSSPPPTMTWGSRSGWAARRLWGWWGGVEAACGWRARPPRSNVTDRQASAVSHHHLHLSLEGQTKSPSEETSDEELKVPTTTAAGLKLSL